MDAVARTDTGRSRALAAVCGVLFLTFLDTTVISVALGDVQADLHAGVVQLQWVLNAYGLVFASLMLTMGTLGDRWGRRRLMVAGIVVFCAGSVLGALAPDATTLIAARAVMGLGAAACEPATLSILRHVYPEPGPRTRALGVWAAVSGFALALGPVIGGVLVGMGSWRDVFWFNLVLGALLLAAVVRAVPESADPQRGGLDLAGFVTGSAFLGCAIFAVMVGETEGLRSPGVLALFGVSGLSLVAFLAAESRSRNPMLDLRLLRRPAVGGPLLVAFAIYFGIFSIFFFTALYLGEVVGDSGYRIAAEFAVMAAAMVTGSLTAGRWVTRRGARPAMVTGTLLAAVGLFLTRSSIVGGHYGAALALALGLAGAGFGIAVVPVTSVVMGAIPAEHSGMAASAANTVRQIGAVAGVAVLGALVNAHLTSDLSGRLGALGVPSGFQSIVIAAIEQGTVGGGGDAAATYGPIVERVIDAAYGAFRSGLSAALAVSAVLMLVATVVAAVTIEPLEHQAPAPGAGTARP